MTITIFLTDDHAIVRNGLRAFLSAQPGIEIVGEASNGRDAELGRDGRELLGLGAGQCDQFRRRVHAQVGHAGPLPVEQKRQAPVATAHVEHACALRDIG